MSDNSGKSGCVWTVVVVIVLVILVGQCGSCSDKEKTVRQEKARAERVAMETKQQQSFNQELVAFLAEYDPSLSAKRGETVRAIKDNQEIRDTLRTKIDKYPDEEAKAVFRTKVDKYEKMIRQLNQLLAAIDKNATIAMAQREASVDEGGGMQRADSQTLLDSASAILKQAAALQNDVESFSNDKPGLPAPSSPLLGKEAQDTLADEIQNKSDPVGNPSSPSAVPRDPRMKALSDQADELEKMADKAAAALELMRKNEAASTPAPKPLAKQNSNPPNPSSKPHIDKEPRSSMTDQTAPPSDPVESPPLKTPISDNGELADLKEELATVNARIESERARYQSNLDIINRLTNFKRTPVQQGTQAYYRCVEASKQIREVEAGAPALKARKARLEASIKELEK